MPLGTLNGTPPPFFRQGPSALSKLVFCSALALLLMVADVRFNIMQPLRATLASILYPVQWLVLRPRQLVQQGQQYLGALTATQTTQAQASQQQLALAYKANQAEQLALENARLRQLLAVRARFQSTATAAQVLYDAADPYSRKVLIDKGTAANIRQGSPVLDEAGVLGQVTRVYPLLSEVTLITDRDHAIPVLNTRTGARGVAFGDVAMHVDKLELRFMAAHADIAVGDLLTTSGIDGIYPPGLPVARVDKVDRRVDTIFARIDCVPLALVSAANHVLVLEPIDAQLPPRPAPTPPPTPAGKHQGAK